MPIWATAALGLFNCALPGVQYVYFLGGIGVIASSGLSWKSRSFAWSSSRCCCRRCSSSHRHLRVAARARRRCLSPGSTSGSPSMARRSSSDPRGLRAVLRLHRVPSGQIGGAARFVRSHRASRTCPRDTPRTRIRSSSSVFMTIGPAPRDRLAKRLARERAEPRSLRCRERSHGFAHRRRARPSHCQSTRRPRLRRSASRQSTPSLEDVREHGVTRRRRMRPGAFRP